MRSTGTIVADASVWKVSTVSGSEELSSVQPITDAKASKPMAARVRRCRGWLTIAIYACVKWLVAVWLRRSELEGELTRFENEYWQKRGDSGTDKGNLGRTRLKKSGKRVLGEGANVGGSTGVCVDVCGVVEHLVGL